MYTAVQYTAVYSTGCSAVQFASINLRCLLGYFRGARYRDIDLTNGVGWFGLGVDGHPQVPMGPEVRVGRVGLCLSLNSSGGGSLQVGDRAGYTTGR